jgi:hypothetical protein
MMVGSSFIPAYVRGCVPGTGHKKPEETHARTTPAIATGNREGPKMFQDAINDAEWVNPDNWSGPEWIAVYFSKKDTRTWVPQKKFPNAGWTQNLGRYSGVCWLYGILFGLLFFTNLIWGVITFGFPLMVKDSGPPRVVSTLPLNGTQDVDPSLTEISVTFNKPMRDGNWSWVYEDKNSFPRIVGQPHFTNNGKTNVVPVKLEPHKEYVIWINSARFKNFKDRNGTPAIPFKFTFTTK